MFKANAFAAGTLRSTILGELTLGAVAALQQGMPGQQAIVLDGRTISYKQNGHFVYFRTVTFSFYAISKAVCHNTFYLAGAMWGPGKLTPLPRLHPVLIL